MSQTSNEPTNSSFSEALDQRKIDIEAEAHDGLQTAIFESHAALRLVKTPAAWRRILFKAWRASVYVGRPINDPCPELPEEADLPTRSDAEKALDSLFAWARRTLARLSPAADASKPSAEPAENSITQDGSSWRIEFGAEHGTFDRNSNKAISYLIRILPNQNRFLTIGDMMGDPEQAIKGDMKTREDKNSDGEAIRAYNRELKEIEDMEEACGQSEHLDKKKAALLASIRDAGSQMMSQGRVAHHSIATAIRRFKKTLANAKMPLFAKHLDDNLAMDFPNFLYRPVPTISWKV